MKLKDLAKQVFMGKDKKTQSICIYDLNEQGKPCAICQDYADEILETHGDKEVIGLHHYSETKECLVVRL